MDILLATKNQHKVKEFSRILEKVGINLLSETDFDISFPDVEETGTTFEENAFLKAKSVSELVNVPVIADDSGLCVDYLDGAPGIYSARFSGENADSRSNNEKLLSLLDGVPEEKRTAEFVCVIACIFPDGKRFSVRGECHGYIAKKMLAEDGFGYDPLFVTDKGCFATMGTENKDAVSHRGRALNLFIEEIKKYM